MVRFGAQGALLPGILTRLDTLENTDLAIQAYNNDFMGYWYNRIPPTNNPAPNLFQNYGNFNNLDRGLDELCRRYGPNFLSKEWIITPRNLINWTNRVGPHHYVVDEWNRMANHERNYPGRCRAIYKTPENRPVGLPENLNDGTNRMIRSFQIVFDPDYTQIVHRTDTISRSDSGLYLNFYVILVDDNRVPIRDNNGSPIKYHMYISFHENLRYMAPNAPLQTNANQPHVHNRLHMAMRRNVNLPIVDTRRYHISVIGYNNDLGLRFAHRHNQDNNIHSRILLAIAEKAYGILRRLRNIEQGNPRVPNGNHPLPIQGDTEGCTPPKPKPKPVGITSKINKPGSSGTSSGPSTLGKKSGKNFQRRRRKKSGGGGYSMNRNPKKIQRFGKKIKKKTKKISSQLKKLCKRLKIRLTVKRGKKRVYKSEKILKAQCKKAASKKKKKVKRRRRSKFGPVNPATPLKYSADAPTPGKLMSPPQWEDISPENSSPSGVSPFMMRVQRRRGRRSTGIRAGPPSPIPFSFDNNSPPSPIPFNLGDFGKKKKKKVKKKRKVVKKKKKSKRKRK